MEGTKESQTQVSRKKKICKDCIGNAILTVAIWDHSLTIGHFDGLGLVNHTCQRRLKKTKKSEKFLIP